MCQLFKMLDRVEDGQRKKGSLFSRDEHLREHLNCLVVKVNLGSAIFIKQSLMLTLVTLNDTGYCV